MSGLQRWCLDALPDVTDAQVTLLASPRATGFSCETVLFDVEGLSATTVTTLRLAARVQPGGYSLYRRHDLERQWRIIDAVGRVGTVPVPRIVGHSDEPGRYLDQPFFVMERIDGDNCADAPPYSVRGWLKDAGPDRQKAVAERSLEVLAAVHRIDPGVLPLACLERDSPVGIKAQVLDYGSFLEWVADGRRLAEMEDAYRWLCDHIPDHDDNVFCWGDSRIGNMLFRDDRPVAVLDWEMATLAPPETDLAWWLVFDRIHTSGRGLPRLPGFPADDEVVARYEQLTGRTVRDLHWYEVWATVRAAVLLFRFHDMLIASGMAPKDPAAAAYQPAVRVLRELLEGPDAVAG